jgi:hypothetical protein
MSRFPSARNKAMIPELPQCSVIPAGKLKDALAQIPNDHGLVPSKVYNLFVVDKNGHNKGYISSSGELHLWPAVDEGRKS